MGPILSVQQPYADLILTPHSSAPRLGKKWCENRTWPTDHRGRLYIHASGKHSPRSSNGHGLTGAILGHVTLEDCVLVDIKPGKGYPRITPRVWEAVDAFALKHGLNDLDMEDESWTFLASPERGRKLYYGLFSHPVCLDQPIPAKGKLRLWNLP